MGLLDDAIREHLELKRLRGADPGEVAREQREALDPVPREPHADQDDPGEDNVPSSALGNDTADVGEAEVAAESLHEGRDHGAPQPARGEDFPHVGQETAELDMRTVLGGELSGAKDDRAEVRLAGGGGVTTAGEPPQEDSLEWEVPGDPSAEQATDGAGDRYDASENHLAGTLAEELGDAGELAEDVLEETPDFLRDTPEQERLWFEQRPPRDFDFDK
jgi:hypothetical protein